MRSLLLLPALFSTAAAPSPTGIADPLRAAIIAGASSIQPENLAFDRASSAVRQGGGTTTTTKRVDRWNGKNWSLISISGKPPSREQSEQHRRTNKSTPIPGYNQLAPIIAAGTNSLTDKSGRTLIEIPVMPAGSVFTDSGDISSHLKAEARIAQQGEKVWIDQLRITEREPFKLNLLIKVTGFSQILDYQLANGGAPRLVSQKSKSSGTMFGFPGGEKAQVTFTYR